ncbi:epoxide hydrolase 4 [Harpegnathos saltator]|uniref:Abhydrolase domain-containing protein 7 n=1 Tax=Harpegnathos saltator TaxID=610380 RepID=E2BIG9_HARSA|nr:epoxide hydrolase 4 [Harpegnathos saltator]EFN84557.1 Abhydrolase domain-containing protein 7 [Harpegnathos saltator]
MDDRIVSVSTFETIQLHFLSFIYGIYLIAKRLLKWAWDPKNFFVLRQRDRPPMCLIDSSLGTHSYVKIKGVKFHYLEAGLKDKPLVLLLHGFPDCWLSWREQIRCLAEHYRVVALDLKGFGDSDKPSNKRSYKVEIIINELKQFILALGVKTCSIIGHDLGGLLGWYMVALHGDLIYKFVAISSPHPNLYWNRVSGNSTLDRKWIHFSRLPFLPEIDALKEDLSIINDTFQHLQIRNELDKKYVEAYKYTFSRKEDWTGPINYYRNFPFIKLNIHEQIDNKMLLIVGNMDPLVTIETVIQSSEYAETSSVKVIPGAQHFPHQEKPDAVNNAIIKFLIGTVYTMEKTASRSIMSSWLGSLSNTVKYGNQMFDAVHKRTNGVVSVLPNKNIIFGSNKLGIIT